MPGFSKMEQWPARHARARASPLAEENLHARRRDRRLAHGDGPAARRADLPQPRRPPTADDRGRIHGNTLRLGIALDWLAANPLTVTALQEEIDEWDAAGFKLDIKSLRELEAGVEAQAA